MKGKIAFVLGATVGYVLGSRAGRERYEQIKRGATKLWETEPVQKVADQVKGAVRESVDNAQQFVVRKSKQVLNNVTREPDSEAFRTADERP